MKRSRGLRRGSPLKKINPKRRKKLHADQFGPPGFADFVRQQGCIIAIERGGASFCEGRVEAAHVHGRGPGWRNNLIGLCRGHHTMAPGSFHHLGSADAFDKRWGTDLDLWAVAITGKWEANEEGAA